MAENALDLLSPDDDGSDAHEFDSCRHALSALGSLSGTSPEVQASIERLAVRQMQRLLIPVIRLSRARQLKRGRKYSVSVPNLKDILRSSPLMALWNDEALQRISNCCRRVQSGENEVALHEGGNGDSGVWVLLRGRVQVVKKAPGTKQCGPRHPGNTVVGVLDAPQVLDDYMQLTEQPRTASIITTLDCDWAVISKADFKRELEALPPRLTDSVYNAAFEKRRDNMGSMFPMEFADLRRSFLFQHFSQEQLRVMKSRLQPRCYREGEFICNVGTPGGEMYFLRRGEVDVMIPRPGVSLASPRARSPPVSPTLSPRWPSSPQKQRSQQRVPLHKLTTVATLKAGSCFGEFSLVFGDKRNASIRALTHCDVWVLLFSDLEVCFTDPEVRGKVREAAHKQRSMWLQNQENQTVKDIREDGTDPEGKDGLLKFVCACPVLREVCSVGCLADIRKALEPRCYGPRDYIISSSDICDRLLVLTRGKALVQQNLKPKREFLHAGEFIGFTCLAETRWLHGAVAQEACDGWELPRTKLAKILRAHGVLAKALDLTKQIITAHPNAIPCEMGPRKTCRLHPTLSDSLGPKVLGFVAGSSDRGQKADSPAGGPCWSEAEVDSDLDSTCSSVTSRPGTAGTRGRPSPSTRPMTASRLGAIARPGTPLRPLSPLRNRRRWVRLQTLGLLPNKPPANK
eukprot:Hpha_TRINITY_DN4339_c0_g1::TRINITY_DN4339_c0_g1_i1::g.50017::m.50017